MKIFIWLSLLLLMGCNRYLGKYVSRSQGSSMQFLDNNEFIRIDGQCLGGVEFSRGNYVVDENMIILNYEKIDDHFNYYLSQKFRDHDHLSIKIYISDSLSNEALPHMTVRLVDGNSEIDGNITNEEGLCTFTRTKIKDQAQIKITGLYYSDCYIDIPKNGDFFLSVNFTEKEKEVKSFVWYPTQKYELIKYTRDSLIMKSIDSEYPMSYVKKH